MATPVLTATNYNLIDTADSTTGWVAFGGAMFAAGSDLLKEGTGAIFIEAKSIARQGAGHDVGSGNEIDLTVSGAKIYIWVNVISQGLVNTKANDGVTVVVSSESTGVFGINDGHWTIGGSDADWVGGGWKLFIIDGARAFDFTTGSPNKASIRIVGATCDWVNTVGKAPSLNIDIIREGTNPTIEVTSPSHTGSADLDFNDNGAGNDTIVRPSGSWITDGFTNGDKINVSGTTNNNKEFTIIALTATNIDVATGSIVDEQNTSALVVGKVSLQDIETEDNATNDTQFGIISKDRNGNFELNGHLIVGDVSGAADTWVEDSGFVLEVQQEFVESGFIEIQVTKDTGTTTLMFGSEVGSGNDSRGVGGGLMKAIFASDFTIDASGSFDEFSWWGGVIDGAVSILLKNTNVEWVSCVIQNCGQIQLESGAEMREGFITDSIEASGIGAIKLIANPIDPEFRDMQLINNIHAMENEINGPLTWDLRNIKFAGNTADIRFNHASGLLTVNVLEGGDTPTTSDGGGGGTITVISSVTLTVTVKDATNGVVVQECPVWIEEDPISLPSIAEGETNSSGVFSSTFGGSTPQNVFVRVRKRGYVFQSISTAITSDGLNLAVSLTPEPSGDAL